MDSKNKKEIAVFGGGCFWCTEAIFKMINGVTTVTSGYSAGAEVVYIEYDSSLVQYETLLTIFFASHDPTTLNRQGYDIGTEYRSVVFYTSDEQRNKALEMINNINESNINGKEIVTEVSPLGKFHKAESYNEDYYERNKEARYCQIIINPKLEKVQKQFADLLKDIYKNK